MRFIWAGAVRALLAQLKLPPFNKDVWSLNQAEISLLVGLIQSPEHYNPETNWEGLKLRQDTVVNVLVEQGLLDAAQAEQIKNQQVTIADPPARQNLIPTW